MNNLIIFIIICIVLVIYLGYSTRLEHLTPQNIEVLKSMVDIYNNGDKLIVASANISGVLSGPTIDSINNRLAATERNVAGANSRFDARDAAARAAASRTTNVQLCCPWQDQNCPRAGPELTCAEFHACRARTGQCPCGGDPWYLKCGYEVDSAGNVTKR